MMMFETSKHVPKTEKHYCVFKNISFVIMMTLYSGGLEIIFCTFIVFRCHHHIFRNTVLVNSIFKRARTVC